MTAKNIDTAAATTRRRASNVLAMAVSAFRQGDVELSFQLFIDGMESNLAAEEAAVAPENLGALIEAALQEAGSLSDEFHHDIALLSDDDMDDQEEDSSFDIDSIGLSDEELGGDDDDDLEDDNDEPDAGDLAAVKVTSPISDEDLQANLAALTNAA